MFINRYRVVYLIIVAIIIVGLLSYFNLTREEMPDVTMPMGIVTTVYTGAAPQEVESLITDKIEGKLKELEDVESIKSTSSNGMSIIRVEFEVGTDIDDKINEIRNKMGEIQNELPEDSQSPIIRGIESSDLPMMALNISGEYDLTTLTHIAEDVSKEIQQLGGISEVLMVGGVEGEIHIYVDPAKLATYNVSTNQIRSAIVNANISMPGGDIELDDTQFNVRVPASFGDIHELENIIVTLQNGVPIFVKDIAQVVDTTTEATSYSKIYDSRLSQEKESTPVITLSIMKDSDGDATELSGKIKNILDEGKGNLYPQDVFVTITDDTGVEVNETLDDVVGNALSGLLVVIIVLYLLIGLRESIIVALVIPLSLFISFYLMEFSNMSLNSMSLVGLILALGMLVDNAIVIMENIDRVREEGLDVVTASKKATNQVAPAVFSSTLTTIVAFLPMATMSGMIGEFLKNIPITIIFSIAASLIMSLSITPTLCSRFLSIHKVKETKNKGKLVKARKILSVVFIFILSLYAFMQDGRIGMLSIICGVLFSGAMALKQFKFAGKSHGDISFIKYYEAMMETLLNSKGKRVAAILIAILLFFGSLMTIPLGLLKIELLPSSDSTNLTIDVDTPSGYLLEDTQNIVEKVEKTLFTYPEMISFVSKIGNRGNDLVNRGDNPNIAQISVELVEDNKRERSSVEIMDSLRADFADIAGAKIMVKQSTFAPNTGSPINIKLIGDNLDMLEIVANDFKDILKTVPGTTEVGTSLGEGERELQVHIDKQQASMLGLDPQKISLEIRNAIQGVDVSTLKKNQEETDIRIKTSKGKLTSINDFQQLYFTSTSGEKIAFSRVASLVETQGISAIEHEDLERVVTVDSNIKAGANSTEILRQFQSKIEDYQIPKGITISYGGDNESITESFTDMFFNMMVAILLVFIILAVQFNSLSQPLVILFAVPLSVIGAIAGLIITNNNFGLYAFMGIVALVGIAVNEAIVLVDYTNYLRKNGNQMKEAIIEAGKTRFLPVLATSITTIGGILPLALKEQDYGQIGFVLIFGLMVCALLTLILIPILYSMVEGIKVRVKRRIPIFVERGQSKGEVSIEN
ncbi:efflux RND transporter permease subunit [Alkaliphilus pronyensis]|uniref:Efflux RND transporter permease subunit n=1 Tax=Alkaliphilus pronyensis TaxID=1482732 RepID=A0A6I0FC83_9FIRM|nr:efflux RND transporter permease subunit [Alkaliphilus pronyensis]KAB3530676.1 efflux RND transporter permease subunit [Alkaliphilus pronyensis]